MPLLLLSPTPSGPSGSPGAITPISSALDLVDLANITATGTPINSVVSFQCADRLNDVTDFTLVVAYDTATIPAFGDVVRLKFNGTTVWAGIIERKQTHPVAQGEETEENITFTGRSLGCLLDRIAVRPTLGFGKQPFGPTRVFGLGDPNVDISGWDTAVELGAVGSAQPFWPAAQPVGMPLKTKGIGTTGDTTSAAAQGYRPIATDWTLDADSAIAMFFTADNSADVDADGFRVAQITAGADTTEGLRTTRQVTFFFTAGTHRITAKLVNVPFGGGDPGWGTGPTLTGNPCRFAAVGYKVDAAGRLGAKVFETDATWKGLPTPSSPPGQGVGEISGLVYTGNADLTPQFTLGYTDSTDTGSTAWPILETVATNVGDSLLKLARDWAALYWSWRFNYSAKQLDAWVIDTYNDDSGVAYFLTSDETSGVVDFTSDQIDVGTDCLLVQYDGGQVRVPTSGGSRMGFLKTNAATAGEAATWASQVLAAQGQPEQVTVKIAPTGSGDIPGLDVQVGQLVSVADGTGARTERLVEWTASYSQDNDEDWDFGITVKDRHLDDLEAISRNLQRMNNGSLGGTAPSAPAGPPPPQIAKVSSSELTFHLQRETIIGDSPAHKFPTGSGNLYAVKISIPTLDVDHNPIVTTSDTTVDLWMIDLPGNTAGVVATVTIPAGSNLAIAAVDPIAWITANATELWPEVTAAAAEAVELTVEPLTV